MSRPLRILISAAEPSGDRLAAEVLAALQAQLPDPVEVRGVAGPALRAMGVQAVSRTEEVSVMGIAEVLRNLRRVTAARARMEAAIDAGGDVLVVVDAPDFHLPLAARAKARGIPVVGIVSPQVWAWRRKRVHHIAATMNRLCCLFDFEPALYEGVGDGDFQAVWTGHPVVDRLPRRTRTDPQRFALLPGSRPQELRRHLGVFLHAAAQIRSRRQGARFVLASPSPPPDLPDWVEVVPSVEGLSDCRAALTKSGTITLELAVMGVPMVVAHRVSPLTYWLGRLLVRQVHHVAMPNVLADQAAGGKAVEVAPEFLQHFTAEQLAEAVLSLPDEQPTRLAALGEAGAAERMAAVVAELLGAGGGRLG